MIRCVSHVIASVRGTCFAGHILSFVLGSHACACGFVKHIQCMWTIVLFLNDTIN